MKNGEKSPSGQAPPAPAGPLRPAPSDWVARFAPLIPAGAPVLDLACGGGRHLRLLAERGRKAVGIDIDPRGAADLAGRPGILLVRGDLEGPAPWPFADGVFAGVVVANYLWRPLFDRLASALRPGGVLIYETFGRGNEAFGRPATAAYLLKPGELLEAVAGRLQVVAYEHGEVARPRAAVVQRLCAVRPPADIDPADAPPSPIPPA